jgi:hypothetical protein
MQGNNFIARVVIGQSGYNRVSWARFHQNEASTEPTIKIQEHSKVSGAYKQRPQQGPMQIIWSLTVLRLRFEVSVGACFPRSQSLPMTTRESATPKLPRGRTQNALRTAQIRGSLSLIALWSHASLRGMIDRIGPSPRMNGPGGQLWKVLSVKHGGTWDLEVRGSIRFKACSIPFLAFVNYFTVPSSS